MTSNLDEQARGDDSSPGIENGASEVDGSEVASSRSTGEAVLVCDKVCKHFEGVPALQDISLEVRKGEVVGLIGPNGSGKTTLLNCISGVLAAQGGRVTVEGRDITGRPDYVCAERGVARTFQNLRLFGNLSVLDNLLIGGHKMGSLRHPVRRQHVRRQRAAELSPMLELTKFERSIAGSLAYGFQRRVEIARALMSEPIVLLLDEPAAGMNHVEADRLGETIGQLRELNIGILLVEHNVALVTKVSDHLVVLDAGQELAQGPPEKIMTEPRVVKAYLG
jgi:ABC-type branched-subunit amino acid transport system ATPase component